jgi:DNA invertase Pin-like site-specific DNA recombinase
MAKTDEKTVSERFQTGKRDRFLAKEEIGVMEASTSNAYNISFNNEIELVRCYRSFSAAGPFQLTIDSLEWLISKLVSRNGFAGRNITYCFRTTSKYGLAVQQGRPSRTRLESILEGTPVQTALYLRVSTAQQKPDLQDDGLRGYATRAGLEIVATYVDRAVSGRQEARPQLQALMRAARRHAFACVLVWKFDRFARSVSHLLRALEEFDYLGLRFISVQDQVDTASPMGKAMFTIIGAMAELESALISERVKAGMAAARTRGQSLGRPATPAPLVARIEGLAATTPMSIRQIHAALAGCVSRSVVGAIVKRVRAQARFASL